MKNKNTIERTASELLDLIVKARKVHNDGVAAYAYASGVLVSLLDWERKKYDRYTTLQDHINQAYERYEKELEKLSVA